MNNKIKIHSIKTLLLGRIKTGKTTLAYRLIHDKFIKIELPTNGTTYCSKLYYIFNKQIKIEIWDTGGNIENINQIISKDIKIFLLLFDLTDINSLNDIKYYYEDIKRENKNKNIIILIGNKSDDIEKRVIFKEHINNLIKKYKMPYFEISCKNGKNIKELENYLCHISFQFLTIFKSKPKFKPLINPEKNKLCLIY